MPNPVLGTPGNIQELKIGFSRTAQTNVNTAETTNILAMLKNDTDFFANNLAKEDDAAEIGKSNEFASQTFPTGWTTSGSVTKFTSSEWLAFAASFCGTSVAAASGSGFTHTMSPESETDFITVGIEPSYLTVIEQVRAGANGIVDRMFPGCCINGFSMNVKAGIGRGNSTMKVDFIGTGQKTEPSGVVLPALTTPHELPAGSISCVLNGFDYASSKNFESMDFSYQRNLQPRYVGGGVQAGSTGVLAGAIEINNRQVTLNITARYVKGSPEIGLLTSNTTGTGTIGLTGGAIASGLYHGMLLTLPAIQYEVAQVTALGNRIGITVNVVPLYDGTDPLFTLQTTNAIATFGRE